MPDAPRGCCTMNTECTKNGGMSRIALASAAALRNHDNADQAATAMGSGIVSVVLGKAAVTRVQTLRSWRNRHLRATHGPDKERPGLGGRTLFFRLDQTPGRGGASIKPAAKFILKAACDILNLQCEPCQPGGPQCPKRHRYGLQAFEIAYIKDFDDEPI